MWESDERGFVEKPTSFRNITKRFTVREAEGLHRVTPNPPEWVLDRCGNDPSAGSPTDTLLRLHLPLNGKV